MLKNNRNFFLDITKGVAIFLMLWGHCIQYCTTKSGIDFFENIVFKTIYSFHMPLFMLISGYLFFYSFTKRSLSELIIHKTQSLLQPIFFCTFFNYFATTVLFGLLSGKFDVAFDGKWLETLPSLSFLWSVLAASLVTSVVCKKCKTLYVQILLFFVFIPVVAIFPKADFNLYLYPYFVLGFYFAKYRDKLPSAVHNLKYLSLPLFPILMCFYEKKHYIYTTGLFPDESYSFMQMLKIDAFRWLIGLVGSVFVLTVLHTVYKQIIIKINKTIITKGLSLIGKHSLEIYALSMSLLSRYLPVFFSKILSVLNVDNVFVENMFVYNFVFTFPLAIIYSFALYYFIKLLKKLKITNIMFGR